MIRIICKRCQRVLYAQGRDQELSIEPCPVCVGNEQQTDAVIAGIQDRLDLIEDILKSHSDYITGRRLRP